MDAVNHVNPGNLVDQPKTLRLIVCPHLAIEHDRIDRYVPEGKTVAEHLRAIGWKLAGLHARVFIDGEFIEQAQWEYAVPRAGQSFFTHVIPTGGAGGGKDVLRMVGFLAIIAATLYVGGGGLGAFLPEALGMAFAAGTNAAFYTAASITVAGTLAMQAHMPPARPRLCDQRLVQHG